MTRYLEILFIIFSLCIQGLDAHAAKAPSLLRLNFGLGVEQFVYSEDHPFQPSLSAKNFQQLSLVGHANLSIWLIPRFTQFVFSGDATLWGIYKSDQSPSVQLYGLHGGFNFPLGLYGRTEISTTFGFASMTMLTPGRVWGFQYLRGPWVKAEFAYALSSKSATGSTLSFIPQYTFLGTTWTGPINLHDRELSLGLQLKLPLTQGKFPAFLFQKDLFLGLYYDSMAYQFQEVRTIEASYSKFRFLLGYEF